MTAVALDCEVPDVSKFDRKNYSYPDLPKGYQISQYDMPMGQRGCLRYQVGDETRECRITRVHLEEDTGKSVHTEINGREVSLVDYNRSGIPLMEIVSDPDLDSPEAARDYFSSLRQILMYLGVCDGNLQEGSMRADVNVSLRGPDGHLGTKVEIKNLNSFRAVQRSLEHEVERQRAILLQGGTVIQETRGWSERSEETVSQRTKEYAHDYRYFPEPDLPALHLDAVTVAKLAERVPEMPLARATRFEREYNLSNYVARVMTDDKALADLYENTARLCTASPVDVANWITGDLLRLLNESNTTVQQMLVTAHGLANLLMLIEDDTVSGRAAKRVLEEMFLTGDEPGAIVTRLDLAQITDEETITTLVRQVLESQASLVQQYTRGKTNVIQALVGKVLQASKGKASPRLVRQILDSILPPVQSS